MSIEPNKWNLLEPSIIRDAVSGRLGFQAEFGTTWVSGATNALALKQNPIDGSPNEGDAYLFIGTTNGGVYSRHYDYQSGQWAPTWAWLSQPSGSPTQGYDGAQGIGALALSPDGNYIAVGRGGSSNYLNYTPNGPAIQIGQVLIDGTVQWLPVQDVSLLSGSNVSGNVRTLTWQNDGLYAAFAQGVNSTQDFPAQIERFSVNSSGLITASDVLSAVKGTVFISASSGPDAPVFIIQLGGQLAVAEAGSGAVVPLTGSSWDTVQQERLENGEILGRMTVAADPSDANQQVLLLGWYSARPPNFAPNYITHVDRLSVDANHVVTAIDSIDFSGKAGSNQALTMPNFGNYALAFDPNDPSLDTVLVGGNHYLTNHPDGQAAYTSTGGLIRGSFTTQTIDAVFGPYQSDDGKLVEQSLLIGAPHADSRAIAVLQTANGVDLIQSDDGGVWLLSASPGDPLVRGWSSLNAPGLNTLEVIASGWDARSNSFVSSFQDNASSIGQLGDVFMHNLWNGDGMLAIMDGAHPDDKESLSWAYLNSQKYMLGGLVSSFGIDSNGDVTRSEVLTMVTNWQGQSVQPLNLVESFAIQLANPDITSEGLTQKATVKGAATVNPYRQGDLVLGGDSGLYETFLPNGSDLETAAGYGTLQLVPVAPFSDSNTVFTAVDLGSSAAFLRSHAAPKPFFWDSLLAASWDSVNQRATIWFRDPVQLDRVPDALSSVDPEFLRAISLDILATSNYAISDIAHTVNLDGTLRAAYWLEVGSTLVGPFVDGDDLQPSPGDEGAALVVYQDGSLVRLPYSQTPGLNQLVKPLDYFGPTSLTVLPGTGGEGDRLVIGGEHGLYAAALDEQGLPGAFEAMSIAGFSSAVQFGSAVTGLVYNAHDDVLSASLLGGGTMLYSQTGDLHPTPIDSQFLRVSETTVPQSLSELTDKRDNAVEGLFLIELPETAFDEQGIAQVDFIISDAGLWRQYLDEVTFYLNADTSGAEFNLLDRNGTTITETLTFFDNATMRMGTFITKSTIKQLPTVTLDYELNLLGAGNGVIQTIAASINLVPNGATPSFSRYAVPQAPESKTFQAQFSFGNGVELQELPFGFKFGLPADLPLGTEVFAFAVENPLGIIKLPDGAQYAPSDPDYLTVAVPAAKIMAETQIVSAVANNEPGIDLGALIELFDANDLTAFLASEGVRYGTTLDALMPGAFDNGTPSPPFLGVAVLYPDGTIKASTIDATALLGNEINLDAAQLERGVVIDVGYGGIFAAQSASGDISVAKLGQLDASFGLVRLDDLFGYIGELAPGDAGYIEAALQRSQAEGLNFQLNQAYGSVEQYSVDGLITGTYYASYITLGYDDVAAALEAINNQQTADYAAALFSFDEANTGSTGDTTSAAIPFAADVIAFEDMPRVGDLDFNDIVVFYGSLV